MLKLCETCSTGSIIKFHFCLSTGTSTLKGSKPWQPNDPCPVKGCLRKQFSCRFQFFSHWKEKHAKVAVTYVCPKCTWKHSDQKVTSQHAFEHHGLRTVKLCAEFQPNENFLDPWPLTLEAILGAEDGQQGMKFFWLICCIINDFQVCFSDFLSPAMMLIFAWILEVAFLYFGSLPSFFFFLIGWIALHLT